MTIERERKLNFGMMARWLYYEELPRFYADPENVRKFEEWKKTRDEQLKAKGKTK